MYEVAALDALPRAYADESPDVALEICRLHRAERRDRGIVEEAIRAELGAMVDAGDPEPRGDRADLDALGMAREAGLEA